MADALGLVRGREVQRAPDVLDADHDDEPRRHERRRRGHTETAPDEDLTAAREQHHEDEGQARGGSHHGVAERRQHRGHAGARSPPAVGRLCRTGSGARCDEEQEVGRGVVGDRREVVGGGDERRHHRTARHGRPHHGAQRSPGHPPRDSGEEDEAHPGREDDPLVPDQMEPHPDERRRGQRPQRLEVHLVGQGQVSLRETHAEPDDVAPVTEVEADGCAPGPGSQQSPEEQRPRDEAATPPGVGQAGCRRGDPGHRTDGARRLGQRFFWISAHWRSTSSRPPHMKNACSPTWS